jgi:hypothetical protein
MVAESKSGKKRGRVGQVRCQYCFKRFRPPEGVEQATCPSCGWAWQISWAGKLAKIRKPVWENWERQLDEAEDTKG